MPDLPSFIGRYRVVERLSSGGMGVVYVARDAAIDRTVAVKVARVHSAELRERFLREARATGRLNHRNIVTIYDVGEHDGEPFIAMEHVPGPTLADIIRRKAPLSLAQRLRMLRELCEGLAYAHGQGIVHRDVKPANLIAREDNGALTILDFGIARLADAVTTARGGVVGTPYYMAPEQIVGSDVDHRCDIFAVGLVFYELLSYRRAFDAEAPTAVLYKIVHEPAVSLAELMPELSGKVVAIVDRALAKQVDDRYQNLGELLADLNAVPGGIGDEAGDADVTISLGRDDEAGTPSGVASRSGRAALLARREAQLRGHLDAANAALERDLCDAAQAAAEQAALLDPDDDRVLRMLERIGAIRSARQVEEHLSNARGHLENAALTMASESVEAALQLQPESPAALRLSREIETRRTVNRHLKKAEQCLSSGDFSGASDSVREVLALDEEHAGALELRDRVDAVARDHRARTAVEEARAKRTAGELAAAQAILEGFDGAHDQVSAWTLLNDVGVFQVTGGAQLRKAIPLNALLESRQPRVYVIGDTLNPSYFECDDFDGDVSGFRKVPHRGNIKAALIDGVRAAEVIAQRLAGKAAISVDVECVGAPPAPRLAGRRRPAVLTLLIDGAVEAEQFVLHADRPTTIGRRGSDVCLADDVRIADRHAVVVPQGDGYRLRDGDSADGVFLHLVEGRERAVTPGTIARLGRQWLVFGAQDKPRLVSHHDPGGRLVRQYELSEGAQIIGRQAPDITLAADDASLSRRHACAIVVGPGVFLRDLNSRNGIYVKIDGSCALAEGDVLRIGHQALRFQFLDTETTFEPRTVVAASGLGRRSTPPPGAASTAVTFRNRGASCPVRAGQTLCDVAEAHGVAITADCHAGGSRASVHGLFFPVRFPTRLRNRPGP